MSAHGEPSSGAVISPRYFPSQPRAIPLHLAIGTPDARGATLARDRLRQSESLRANKSCSACKSSGPIPARATEPLDESGVISVGFGLTKWVADAVAIVGSPEPYLFLSGSGGRSSGLSRQAEWIPAAQAASRNEVNSPRFMRASTSGRSRAMRLAR